MDGGNLKLMSHENKIHKKQEKWIKKIKSWNKSKKDRKLIKSTVPIPSYVTFLQTLQNLTI